MPKKLSRREVQLVSNARRAAIEKFADRQTIKLVIQGNTLVDASLSMLRNINLMAGTDPWVIELGNSTRCYKP